MSLSESNKKTLLFEHLIQHFNTGNSIIKIPLIRLYTVTYFYVNFSLNFYILYMCLDLRLLHDTFITLILETDLFKTLYYI